MHVVHNTCTCVIYSYILHLSVYSFDNFNDLIWGNSSGSALSNYSNSPTCPSPLPSLPISPLSSAGNSPAIPRHGNPQKTTIKPQPPEGYLCHLCFQSGHFIKDCHLVS